MKKLLLGLVASGILGSSAAVACENRETASAPPKKAAVAEKVKKQKNVQKPAAAEKLASNAEKR